MTVLGTALRTWLLLDDPVQDGTPAVYQPEWVQARVLPGPPSTLDESRVTYQVEMRFHPQVTFNTRIRFTDTVGQAHTLFVRGIQNVEMRGQDLILLAEEVLTP